MPITLSHDHVAIRAVDYAGTIAWYQDKLDFTLDQEWPFGDMRLAYLSNGTAKIEILGGAAAEPHATIDSLDDSFGVEEYHHFCLNVADVDANVASDLAITAARYLTRFPEQDQWTAQTGLDTDQGNAHNRRRTTAAGCVPPGKDSS